MTNLENFVFIILGIGGIVLVGITIKILLEPRLATWEIKIEK